MLKQVNITLKIFIISFIFITIFLSSIEASSPPTTISYQGYLTNSSGDPINETVSTMTFKFYDALTGGSATYAETHSNVSVSQGRFTVELGNGTPTTGTWSSNPDFSQALWLEITVGSDTLSPRIPLKPSPYTRMALDVADSAVTASKLNGSPGNGTSGQILTSDGSGGFAWQGNAAGTTILSSKDSANSVYIHSNGGTSETIKIHSDQGTSDSSIEITSDSGGVAMNAATSKSISMKNNDSEILGIDGNGIDLESSKAFYFGDSSTTGTWRITRSGDNLSLQRYSGSSWVTKLTISN